MASMVVECLIHPSCERDIKGRREEGQVLTTGEQKARSPVVWFLGLAYMWLYMQGSL